MLDRVGFQTPRHVETTDECIFYHTMEIPRFGLQHGEWDLREDLPAYFGSYNCAGKRIVDVGTASGFIAFEMERRGGIVTAFDRVLTDDEDMGLVPFADFDKRHPGGMAQAIQDRIQGQTRLQNSFWLSHRLLGSSIRLYCGSAYDCPPELGEFDCAFFGAILLHLRDPLKALASFAAATRETMIVTEPLENVGPFQDGPVMFFRPNVADNNVGTWWYITPFLLRRYLEILGFQHFEQIDHRARIRDQQEPVPFCTIVATR